MIQYNGHNCFGDYARLKLNYTVLAKHRIHIRKLQSNFAFTHFLGLSYKKQKGEFLWTISF